MKKIIVIINLLLLINFLSCTKKDKISITDKYDLNLMDTISISYQLKSPSVIIDNGYILLYSTEGQSINVYDSIGNLIFIKDIFGESPGKGYGICVNGTFIRDDKLYIIYYNPPKISKYTLNGEFIEDIKYSLSWPVNTSKINKDYIVIAHISYNGLEYVILDETDVNNPISEFIVKSDINESKYINYFEQNPFKVDMSLTKFSIKDTFLYMPDLFTGLLHIYTINGDIVDKVEIVNDYYPPPFIDVKKFNEIENIPIPERAISPPIFLDSLIIIRVSDKYKNDWEKAKNIWLSINDPEIEKYKDFLYIFNNNFELLDTVELPIVDIGLIFCSNDLIYVPKNVNKEDSSYIIFYRYRLEKK